MPRDEMAILVKTTLLKTAGYGTIYAAAKAIDIDPRTLDRICKGEVSPSIDTLERVFDAIDWDVTISFAPRKKSR